MILKSEGYMVETTDLGEDAYELGKFYEYDIIILDLMLPDMHGYEVLKKLRAEKINIPILILSGLAELDSKIKGLGFGADDYLTKPFEKAERSRVSKPLFAVPKDIPKAKSKLVACRSIWIPARWKLTESLFT